MSSLENGSENQTGEVMIQLDRVTRQFGNTKAVDDVSFAVKTGEVFGFIGPNGAGKTTSMRILSTLDVPTEGEAFVDGFSVVDDPDRVRRRLGWMPDGFGAYPNVSCEEYLDFFARSYGLHGKKRTDALKRVMSFTQLDQLAFKPIDGLSKGMKQRLCLGRALIHDPKVLILDEPAAGLDPRARIELRDMIGELAAQGKSLLISSHILTELAEMCDRVGIIEQGRMLAVGSVDEILHHPTTDTDSPDPNARLATVTATVLTDTQAAADWLMTQELVSSVQILAVASNGSIRAAAQPGNGKRELRFSCPPDPEFQADLIKRMVEHEFRVVSFAAKQKSLEEAFLKVTRGRIQ